MITPPPTRDMARAGRSLAPPLAAAGLHPDLLHPTHAGFPHLVERRIAEQETDLVAEGARVSRADDDAPQRRRAAAMRGGGFARMQSVGDSPLDDEWDRAGFRACAYVLGPPAEDLAVRPRTRTFGDRRR